MKPNAAPNAARSANPIAPMKPFSVKTGVRAGLSGTIFQSSRIYLSSISRSP
jgi:hypothetical protein